MNKKEVFAWSVYDMANTAFSALFVTFFFPLYIKEYLGGTEFHIGLVFGLSMLLVALVVPFIGALSDRIGKRMPFIILFTIICCIFTYLVIQVDLYLALLFGFIANFFYHAALTTYNALLPKIAKTKETGRVSGFGVAMGYLGTLLALIMTFFILNYYGWENLQGIRAMFPATALFFIGFSLIPFIKIEESKKKTKRIWQKTIDSFKDVKHTIINIKHNKGLLHYIIAMFMYVNAINAVIVFLYLYGRTEINLSIQSFMVVYIVFSIAAAIGSFIFGKIVDKIGPKKSLGISGILWIIALSVLYQVSSFESFLLGGIIGGIALGSVWTAMRPLTIQLSPKKNIGQYFGFLELTDKFSGVIGPILFGFLASFIHYKAAMISLFIFFILGLLILQFVPEQKK